MKGIKNDMGKNRWDLLPMDIIDELVGVVTYGANKYDDNNWRKVDSERYYAAMFRHIVAWRLGEEKDSESGCHHLAHAMCNLMFIFYKERHRE